MFLSIVGYFTTGCYCISSILFVFNRYCFTIIVLTLYLIYLSTNKNLWLQ